LFISFALLVLLSLTADKRGLYENALLAVSQSVIENRCQSLFMAEVCRLKVGIEKLSLTTKLYI
jgi:hypothetical protein